MHLGISYAVNHSCTVNALNTTSIGRPLPIFLNFRNFLLLGLCILSINTNNWAILVNKFIFNSYMSSAIEVVSCCLIQRYWSELDSYIWHVSDLSPVGRWYHFRTTQCIYSTTPTEFIGSTHRAYLVQNTFLWTCKQSCLMWPFQQNNLIKTGLKINFRYQFNADKWKWTK